MKVKVISKKEGNRFMNKVVNTATGEIVDGVKEAHVRLTPDGQEIILVMSHMVEIDVEGEAVMAGEADADPEAD